MKALVIGSRQAVVGFRLAGVDGIVATDRSDALPAFQAAVVRKDLGLVMVTEGTAHHLRKEIDARLYGTGFPLVVEIPEPDGPDPARQNVGEIVRRAIGMNL